VFALNRADRAILPVLHFTFVSKPATFRLDTQTQPVALLNRRRELDHATFGTDTVLAAPGGELRPAGAVDTGRVLGTPRSEAVRISAAISTSSTAYSVLQSSVTVPFFSSFVINDKVVSLVSGRAGDPQPQVIPLLSLEMIRSSSCHADEYRVDSSSSIRSFHEY
jgi:hypothetical protein